MKKSNFKLKFNYIALKSYLLLGLLSFFFMSPAKALVLNNPYPTQQDKENIFYSSFNEQPKTLDPAKSYSSNEYQFITQIYEPLLQYDYLARPYSLVPLRASHLPELRFINQFKQVINKDEVNTAAYTIYTLRLKKRIFYQPHPAFAKTSAGQGYYFNLPQAYLSEHHINELSDFKQVGTRELVADDYLYAIKRLANPAIGSPIYELMSEHILGFREFATALKNEKSGHFIDLRKYPLEGLKKLDDYSFEITIKGQYPQFIFWLAMPFFAPIPWEADYFYSQVGMEAKNISWGWYPVGTGPFMLSENNPNRRMILTKNPHYKAFFTSKNASVSDLKAGFLRPLGSTLPLIDKAIYSLEKEGLPRWNKFLQGYYDLSALSNDSFDQAIQMTEQGIVSLTSEMQEKKLRLSDSIEPAIYYLGFNMLDKIVGGYSERARKLRLALAIAINYEENIAIFHNGRGQVAQGPLPPGIFGYQKGVLGINNYIYQQEKKRFKRRSLQEAQILLEEAGYPKGVDPQTGQPLILHYDVTATGGPDDKAQFDWLRKQIAALGIDLNVRATQYNRFQEKIRNGNAQLFSLSWSADYPDPENFLFLFYSRNGKVHYGGENTANYNNPVFDQLFDRMKNRNNDEERQRLLNTMVELLQHDSPWVWGFHPQNLVLSQQWVAPVKPNPINLNSLKYVAIDVNKRQYLRVLWNQALLWPLALLGLLFLLLFLPLMVVYRKKDRQKAVRISS